MYEMVNGKGMKLKLPDAAKKFFGLTNMSKTVLCMPISGVSSNPATVGFEYKVNKVAKQRKRQGTLVIRMGGLGDLIMLSSGLRSLGEPVTVATLKENVPFMESMGFTCIPIDDVGKYKFEQVIDLRFAVEPPELGEICKGTWADYTTKDRSDVFDELLGVYPARKRFTIPVNPDAVEAVMKKIKVFNDDTFVAINASMVASARSIPQKYIRPLCSDLIKKLKVKVVLFGQSQPWNQKVKHISMPGLVNMVDHSSLDEMIALLVLADLVVTPDTGSLYIAGALGKKTLGIFGNINPRTRISYYPTVRPLYPHGEMPCIPCWDLHPCESKPRKPVACMELLTPGRMANAVKELGGY